MKMYNTLMALSAGAGLLLLVQLGRELLRGRRIVPEGWAATFAALGAIMTFLGGVMTVTWPLPALDDKCCKQDNIIFGEPVLAFGVLMLVAAWMLMRIRAVDSSTPDNSANDAEVTLWPRLAAATQPIAWFAAALGLSLLAIAVVGVQYKLYAAPPQEPISGRFADKPLLEATFISSIYALVGIGAVLFPFGLRATAGDPRQERITHISVLLKITAVCWVIAGVALTVFGALNYYTHVGLIMELKQQI